MSWDWVRLTDDSYLSSTGWNCHILIGTGSPPEPFFMLRFGGQEVTRKYFDTYDQAWTAMLEFIARCEKQGDSVVTAIWEAVGGLQDSISDLQDTVRNS